MLVRSWEGYCCQKRKRQFEETSLKQREQETKASRWKANFMEVSNSISGNSKSKRACMGTEKDWQRGQSYTEGTIFIMGLNPERPSSSFRPVQESFMSCWFPVSGSQLQDLFSRLKYFVLWHPRQGNLIYFQILVLLPQPWKCCRQPVSARGSHLAQGRITPSYNALHPMTNVGI